MELLDTIGLAALPAAMVLDFAVRRTRYTTPRFWRLQGFVVSAAAVLFSFTVVGWWASVLPEWSLFNGSALGIAGGAIVGILLYELVHYGYHRLVHRSDRLFRWAHQMHHSAEAIDPYSAYYLHPIDVAAFTTWPVLVFFPVLGLNPIAASIAGLFITFNAVFQHANIRTPHWVGYIIQRPESHAIHHKLGYHRDNYADLPLWDMIFGTFNNPRAGEEEDVEVGFYLGASRRVPEMLLGRDVTEPPTPTLQLPAIQQP